MYSGREFAWLYERCDQLAFLDGHIRAFTYMGGVARRCIYDNLKPAVRRIIGSQRVLSGRFQALVNYYLFEPDFTRIGEGHDKGGVESRGKSVRLQHLTPIPSGESLNEISQALMSNLGQAFSARRNSEGKSMTELWAQERERLLALPAMLFEVSRMVPVEVSSQSLVRVEGAWYSVPSRWARLSATAYVGVNDVRISCLGESVTHPRARFGSRTVRYRYYLRELSRSPRRCARLHPSWWRFGSRRRSAPDC